MIFLRWTVSTICLCLCLKSAADGAMIGSSNPFVGSFQKLIKLTGDRAKLDAKANGTYIFIKTDKGNNIHIPLDSERIVDTAGPRARE